MAGKKIDAVQPQQSSGYQRLRVPSTEDYPRIATIFTKVQILGGIIASKVSAVFTGFYISDISEEWKVESTDDKGVGGDFLVVRFQLKLTSHNKKMFQQLSEIQSTNGEVLSANEVRQLWDVDESK